MTFGPLPRYLTVCAAVSFPVGLSIAPGVLLFTERGVPLAAVAGLVAAHAMTTALLELPTGGLADALGRRWVLVAALVLSGVALTTQGLGTSIGVLTAGMVLAGAAGALASGPAEAWYVDAERRRAPDGDLRTGLARGSAVASLSMGAGILAGGALPWLVAGGLADRLETGTGGMVLPLSVPLLVGAAINLGCAGYVVSALREPPRPAAARSTALAGVLAAVLGGLRLSSRDGVVRRVMLSAVASGAALVTLEVLAPGRAASATGLAESGALLFALLTCGGLLSHAGGGLLAPPVGRALGSGERALLAGQSGSTVGMLLIAATALSSGVLPSGLALFGYALVYLGQGVGDPNAAALLHRRVPEANRATAVSLESLALRTSGALMALLVTRLPSGYGPWGAAALAMLAGALVWVRRTARDAAGPAPSAAR
ncbi:MFS transporter [Streptomyces sp. ODS05-4]|uniref:MFS transporter n=1 Tax=Streptomyces sp. ODS05-4 TaxID=2944939 RepID=UPI00210CB7C8|nr:MFS transporter [Streptomyces sp. ODS05-4]